MKAIILAAGEGFRLRPYTLDRPKCLVEVDGRSLLDRQLDVLALGNINPIMLIGGYRAEMLRREGIELRINLLYADLPESTPPTPIIIIFLFKNL